MRRYFYRPDKGLRDRWHDLQERFEAGMKELEYGPTVTEGDVDQLGKLLASIAAELIDISDDIVRHLRSDPVPTDAPCVVSLEPLEMQCTKCMYLKRCEEVGHDAS